MSLGKTETVPNPFEYVGEYGVMNDGNGLDFMRARHYQPDGGRFVQPDPIGMVGGYNLYAYAYNSPVGWIDPLGLSGLGDFINDVGDEARQLERIGRDDDFNDIIDRTNDARQRQSESWRDAFIDLLDMINWTSLSDRPDRRFGYIG